jgi:hypothetical protein
MRKTVHLGAKLGSFASAAESVAETLEVELTTKRVERLTERIGRERVAERELSIADWEALPLVAKLAAPQGIKAPAVAGISCDGGRMQRCDLPEDAKSHWCETKVGALLEIAPNPHDVDPCPQVPTKFLDVVRMEQVTREIKRAVPKGQTFESSEKSPPTSSADSSSADSREAVATTAEEIFAEPPVVESRDVVASLADSAAFGKQLAAHAWSLGFAAALLKFFIADGSSTNWGIWQRHFKHLEFVPILDFIHALTYVYSAAMAGHSREAGGLVYVRWITWIWQGEVTRVIAELAARAVELGPLSPDTADTDPRQIVADTLTYLTNQQSRMNYPAYRRLGLPITSSHIESTVKQISRRVKGSEKFWTEPGGEALLQLRADQLCDTAPLDSFWLRRTRQATGTRNYKRSTQITA